MRRFFIRYLIAPVTFYFLILAIIALLVGPSGGAINWLSIYILAFPLLTFVWWGTVFSRWVYQQYNWKIFSYLIANIFWGIGLFGIGLSLDVGVINDSSDPSLIFTQIGFWSSILWFSHSIYDLLFKRKHIQQSVHWLPLQMKWTAKSFDFLSSKDKLKRSQVSEQEKKFLSENSETQVKKQKGNTSSIFRSVIPFGVFDSEDGSVAIPSREETQSQRPSSRSTPNPQENHRPQFQIRFSVSGPGDNFIEDAQKYVNRVEQKATPVPFMQYWPTYSSMDQSQRKWYFYWRDQLRQGNRLPTDTSYLFVYIYEVINLIGFQSPKEAANHLVKFWGHYRQLQPKLDNYLPDWIADFIIIHDLPMTALQWYSKVAKIGTRSNDNLLIEAWLAAGGDFDKLSNDLIFRLADYNPTKSKFYKQQGTEVGLDKAYKQGLVAVDTQIHAETGLSLFEYHQPSRTRTIKRHPFASAVHTYPHEKIEIAKVHTWYGSQDLSNTIRSTIKYTENMIREQNGYRYKLRDIDLNPQWEAAIERKFTKTSSETKLEIDLSQVKKLQQESEVVRDRLTAEQDKTDSEPITMDNTSEDTTPTSDDQSVELDMTQIDQLKQDTEDVRDRLLPEDNWIESDDIKQPNTQDAISTTTPAYIQRPDNAPDELLTDLVEIAAILGVSDSPSSTVLSTMMNHNWQCTTEIVQTKLDGLFANVIIDQINENAFDQIGDALIYNEDGQWIVADEYRDEIHYILEHPHYQEQVATQSDPTMKFPELDTEWATFVDKLEPYHWDVLAAILNGTNVRSRIDASTIQAHKTGNIAIDEINEFAYDTIGDLLIDTISDPPEIIEDEHTHIAELINWAANRQLIEV